MSTSSNVVTISLFSLSLHIALAITFEYFSSANLKKISVSFSNEYVFTTSFAVRLFCVSIRISSGAFNLKENPLFASSI